VAVGFGYVPVALVLRNGQVESVHYGAAAVAAPDGRLLAQVGSAHEATFLRSAAKPFQALPLLASPGVERFALDAADIALLCASHSALPAHTERAASLLARGGLTPADLACGAHLSLDPAWEAEHRRLGRALTDLDNNCSGKHAGFLLACRLAGWPTQGYLDPAHPLQRRILTTLAEILGLEEREIGLATDGCSAPTFRVPLAAAARGYAALADPERSPAERWWPYLAQAVEAMGQRPDMVAGPGRFTTRLMEVTGGRVIGKEGHEGFYALAVRGPEPVGVALKIADGSDRARSAVVLALLHQLGSLAGAELAELAPFTREIRTSCLGAEVGETVADFELGWVG
jgi:L-asparaginase II